MDIFLKRMYLESAELTNSCLFDNKIQLLYRNETYNSANHIEVLLKAPNKNIIDFSVNYIDW